MSLDYPASAVPPPARCALCGGTGDEWTQTGEDEFTPTGECRDCHGTGYAGERGLVAVPDPDPHPFVPGEWSSAGMLHEILHTTTPMRVEVHDPADDGLPF